MNEVEIPEKDLQQMLEEPKTKNDVKERLEKLGALFQQRNGDYGDTFRSFGLTMVGFFPEGLTVKTVEDWNRLALYMHVMDKMARYATNFPKGGHKDSLDDVAVYAQILQMIDAEKAKASSIT